MISKILWHFTQKTWIWWLRSVVSTFMRCLFFSLFPFFPFSSLRFPSSNRDINPIIFQEPKDQLMDPTFWADEAKLNQLRRQGVRFARIRLQAGDVYCIPRRVVHQFQTVSGCISVTWHLKYGKYYTDAAKEEEPKDTPTTGRHSSKAFVYDYFSWLTFLLFSSLFLLLFVRIR